MIAVNEFEFDLGHREESINWFKLLKVAIPTTSVGICVPQHSHPFPKAAEKNGVGGCLVFSVFFHGHAINF
jgi:hypothetical protein